MRRITFAGAMVVAAVSIASWADLRNAVFAGGVNVPSKLSLTSSRFDRISGELRLLRASNDPRDVERFKEVLAEIRFLVVPPVAENPAEFDKQRKNKVPLVLRLMTSGESRIDPQFDPDKDVPFLNFAPPAASGMPAGICTRSDRRSRAAPGVRSRPGGELAKGDAVEAAEWAAEDTKRTRRMAALFLDSGDL